MLARNGCSGCMSVWPGVCAAEQRAGAVLAAGTGDEDSQALLKLCHEREIEVLAYSPLAFGVLSQPPGTGVIKGTALRRRIFQRLLPASEELRQELNAIAEQRSVSMVQVALNWCRAKGTTPFLGCDHRSRRRMLPLPGSGLVIRMKWNAWIGSGPGVRSECLPIRSRVADAIRLLMPSLETG